MQLDPEMRTLLKQLADNTGRLARAVEAILDDSREGEEGFPLTRQFAEEIRQGQALAFEGSGGRMDIHASACDCQKCEEWHRANR